MPNHRAVVPATAAIGVVVIDQITKAAAAHRVPVAHNPDLAFGVAGGSVPTLVGITVLVLAVFIAVVGRWAIRLGISPMLPALIVGGMLANAVDRLRFGAVRDFLATPFATFNVADVVIASGIVALATALATRARRVRPTTT